MGWEEKTRAILSSCFGYVGNVGKVVGRKGVGHDAVCSKGTQKERLGWRLFFDQRVDRRFYKVEERHVLFRESNLIFVPLSCLDHPSMVFVSFIKVQEVR